MELFLRVDINIVAFAVLLAVYCFARSRFERTDRFNRTFLSVSRIIMLQLVIETVTCIINGRPERYLYVISVIMHICLYVMAPLLTYYWFLLIYSLVLPDKPIAANKRLLLLAPVALNGVLAGLSPFFGILFTFTDNNVYRRGPLFPFSAALTYFYLIYSLYLIIRNTRKIIRNDLLLFLTISVIPVLGGLFQSLFYGVLLMWSSTAFALVVSFMFLQQRTVLLDDLTGVWSRGSFENYMARRLRIKGGEPFSLIFGDIDGLKRINDVYGHTEGDDAIKTAASVIRDTVRKSDIVVRMGGDEFVIITDGMSSEALEKTLERLDTAFLQYNIKNDKPYSLSCSFGADMYSERYTSIEQFLHHVDSLMYKNKQKKKELSAAPG